MKLSVTLFLASAAAAGGAEGSATKTVAKANGSAAASATATQSTIKQSTEAATEDSRHQRQDRSDRPALQASTERWIHRWRPQKNTGEIGAFGGVLLPGQELELFEADANRPQQGYEQYRGVSSMLGGRAGYFPSRFFGLEAEGGAAPSQTITAERATIWTARGSLVGQVGLWSVSPFALIGAGALGVTGNSVGKDVDGALHVGGGLKVFLSQRAQVRVDLRDVIGSARGVELGVNHNFEATVGVGLTLGRKSEPEPKTTTPAPLGTADPDSDGDGVLDRFDRCVAEPGNKPDGCPAFDSDEDGVFDDDDRCPSEPADTADGCPIADKDGDGIVDDDDQCVDVPGVADRGGCPTPTQTTSPEPLSFEGTLEGIRFKTGSAEIAPASKAILDETAGQLMKHPAIAVVIAGHTDSQGSARSNQKLSAERAAAVRLYLVGRGVSEQQLSTRGAGESEPRADNASKKGRAANRRIDFEVQR